MFRLRLYQKPADYVFRFFHVLCIFNKDVVVTKFSNVIKISILLYKVITIATINVGEIHYFKVLNVSIVGLRYIYDLVT